MGKPHRAWLGDKLLWAILLLVALVVGLGAPTAPYTPTNVTPDRSYDATATSLGEIANVLGTLIADLQSKGIVS